MGPQMQHHFAAYGFYSKAIGDYEQMKVLNRMDSQGGGNIRNFVDPYEYRDRYTMPNCHQLGGRPVLPVRLGPVSIKDLPAPTLLPLISIASIINSYRSALSSSGGGLYDMQLWEIIFTSATLRGVNGVSFVFLAVSGEKRATKDILGYYQTSAPHVESIMKEKRGKIFLAVQTLRNWIMASSFLASTAILIGLDC